jgi:hypothetical protein
LVLSEHYFGNYISTKKKFKMAARYNGHKDDDDHYDYSDSFVSDDDDESVKKHPTTRKVAQGTL